MPDTKRRGSVPVLDLRKATAQSEETEERNLRSINQNIFSSLSGLGEPPQFGNRVDLSAIQNAIRTSERGEPYYLFALFRDMIENDSHIQAEIGKRIMSFIGQNETIEPFQKGNAEDEKAAEAILDMISNCDNWREGCLHLAQGHIWPVSGAEKIYARVEDRELFKYRHPVKWRLKKLHPIPWPLFTYKVAYWNLNVGFTPQGGMTPNQTMTNSGAMPIQDVQNYSALNLQGIRQNNNAALIWNPNDWHADLRFYTTFANGLIDWTMANCYKPDPDRHVIHSASVATSSMRENFGGILRGLIFWWFLGQQGRDWFARAMERYASPFAVAYANTANKNIFDLLTKAFNQATKVNALIVPPQAKIELKEVMVSGMADGYAKFIELCNTEKTKAILGQTLSTSPKGTGLGSGVADLQGEVRSEWRIYDERAFAEMEQSQIFEQYLRINGFKGSVPRSVRGGITFPNQALVAMTYANLAKAGWTVDEGAAPDMTKMFGVKMKFEPKLLKTQEPKDDGGKTVDENN